MAQFKKHEAKSLPFSFSFSTTVVRRRRLQGILSPTIMNAGMKRKHFSSE